MIRNSAAAGNESLDIFRAREKRKPDTYVLQKQDIDLPACPERVEEIQGIYRREENEEAFLKRGLQAMGVLPFSDWGANDQISPSLRFDDLQKNTAYHWPLEKGLGDPAPPQPHGPEPLTQDDSDFLPPTTVVQQPVKRQGPGRAGPPNTERQKSLDQHGPVPQDARLPVDDKLRPISQRMYKKMKAIADDLEWGRVERKRKIIYMYTPKLIESIQGCGSYEDMWSMVNDHGFHAKLAKDLLSVGSSLKEAGDMFGAFCCVWFFRIGGRAVPKDYEDFVRDTEKRTESIRIREDLLKERAAQSGGASGSDL